MFASALLLSGNNYKKISQLASFLKLPILKPVTFHKIQRTYLVPCINNYWIDVQEEILAEYRNRDVVLLGMLSLTGSGPVFSGELRHRGARLSAR